MRQGRISREQRKSVSPEVLLSSVRRKQGSLLRAVDHTNVRLSVLMVGDGGGGLVQTYRPTGTIIRLMHPGKVSGFWPDVPCHQPDARRTGNPNFVAKRGQSHTFTSCFARVVLCQCSACPGLPKTVQRTVRNGQRKMLNFVVNI